MEQTHGRGRQGRQWVPRPGNFYGSTIVTVRPGDPPPQSLSLACGLALIEAADSAALGMPLVLKWPNDLLLGHSKLAGILLERSGDRIVAGFGVNLANSPRIAGTRTADLGGSITPQAFAPLLAGSMARMLGLWRSGGGQQLRRAWLARAHPVGTPVTVHGSDAQPLRGSFEGLEEDGALRLRLADGSVQVVRAGDVLL